MLHLQLLTVCTSVALATGFLSELDNIQNQQTRDSAPLIWAIKLDMQTVAEDHVLWAADTVANDVGMHNLGQIGALFGYFALMLKTEELEKKDQGSHITNRSDKLPVISEKSKPESTFFSKEVSVPIERSITQLLDRHVFVEWHSRQSVLVRNSRTAPVLKLNGHRRRLVRRGIKSSVEFNDPMFHKQWHLVSGSSFIALYLLSLIIFQQFAVVQSLMGRC